MSCDAQRLKLDFIAENLKRQSFISVANTSNSPVFVFAITKNDHRLILNFRLKEQFKLKLGY